MSRPARYAARNLQPRRRRTSAALTSAERSALLATYGRDLIALLDSSARFIYLSPSYEAVLGYAPAALLGASAVAYLHPDDLPALDALWAQILTAGTAEASYRHRHADGSWRHIEARGTRLERNGALCAAIVGHDVTERRRTEQALHDERRRLRLALDAARMGIWEWEIATGVVTWSPHLEIMHGFAPGTFGGTFAEFINTVHPDDREWLVAAIQQAVSEGSPFSVEFRNVWPDGSLHWIAGEGQAFHDQDGRPTRMVGIGIDMSERRQAREALRQSEERYRAFIAQSSEGIWRFELEQPVDPALGESEQIELFYRHGYLAECNDAMARMYGLERADQLIGVRLGDLLVRSDPSNEDYLRAFIRAGYRLNDAESHEVDLEGQPRYFLNNLVGIFEEGRLARAWGSQRNITERKQIEEDRARLFRESQEAVRLRDIFFSVAAHELKTPLTSLLGQAQLLQRRGQREGTLSERDSRTVGVVAEQAARLNKMVAALLDVSRLEQGKLSIERASLDLGALITRVVDELRPTLTHHTIEYTAPDTRLPLEGDELRLEQVLQNLLGNAIKYSPDGGPVAVRVERCGTFARLSIRDQGIGIPPDALSQLFGRFYRADNVDDRQFAGLGIGLYVVREIVEMHGGTVSVESREGQGSIFTITLPLSGSL
jgi:PAS domain S-box-containing protein